MRQATFYPQGGFLLLGRAPLVPPRGGMPQGIFPISRAQYESAPGVCSPCGDWPLTPGGMTPDASHLLLGGPQGAAAFESHGYRQGPLAKDVVTSKPQYGV